jgi:hypothetical protein
MRGGALLVPPDFLLVMRHDRRRVVHFSSS